MREESSPALQTERATHRSSGWCSRLSTSLRRRIEPVFQVAISLCLGALFNTLVQADEPPHWAYEPVRTVAMPGVRDADWPRMSVDRFVLRALEERGLAPAPDAGREALLRRLSFDLWGLPPDLHEQTRFAADPSPEAYERLVDRLLADPRHAQRMARHWLDVVRFAESLTLRGFIFPEAWRYRDYVIQAFAEDRPYDEFLREQIAGDLGPGDDLPLRQRRLVATTVWMLGNTNLEEQDKQQLDMDLIDDQIDLLGRGFLGQTLSCARCHDHKFDPIPTADYYALAGIFKGSRMLAHENVSKWLEQPLPLSPDEEAPLAAFEAEVAARQKVVKERQQQLAQLAGPSKRLDVATLPGIVVDDTQARQVGEWQHSTSVEPFVGTGYLHDKDAGKGEKSLTFQPVIKTSGRYEVRLAYTPGTNRTDRAPVTVFSADGEQVVHVNQKQAPPIDRVFVSLGKFRFEANGAGFVMVSNAGTQGHVIADAVQFLAVGDDGETAEPKTATVNTTKNASVSEIESLRRQIQELEAELKRFQARGPRRPKVMTVIEQPGSQDLPIHLRGSVHTPGPVVPRGVPGWGRDAGRLSIREGESGRRQLADWVTSPDNPLTARVYVNRVWHWLLGRGLVASTDNWGRTGDRPSHPELLDHLTAEFQRHGWSTRWLVREIVLSRVYQLSDQGDAGLLEADPGNAFLGRHLPRRLEAEELRDALLAASGELSLDAGGPGFPQSLEADYGFTSVSPRRSIYLPVFRNAVPDLFEAFDIADPSSVTGVRGASTVAPQALVVLNHPFVVDASARLARRVAGMAGPADERVDLLYRLLIGRSATSRELALGRAWLQSVGDRGSESALADLAQAVVATVEFRHLR
jgi:hypothetical protein